MRVPQNLPIDAPFVVPFVHRLRFTEDVLGADEGALVDLLEPSGNPQEGQARARVQFWLDDRLVGRRPDLIPRLEALVRRNDDRLVAAGNVQIVAGGEACKNDIHILERMLKVFHAADLDRRSYVVVIGGGAVLDAVGFAAAIAHRGLRLVRLPTTTLGQADSGVGVKNGVNLFGKKNWVGAFAAPWGVVNDRSLLATLDDRDFRCGFAEALKVSLLKDPQMFADICRQATRIARREGDACMPIVRASAEWHLKHITRGGDPFEMNEARPLDFGHWSAHKLETLTDFRLRHGEAVAIGVAIDCAYSALVHGLPRHEARRVYQCLNDLGFTLDDPALEDPQPLFAGLEEFRQHLGGRLTLTMLHGVGDPFDVHEVDREAMEAAISDVVQWSREAARSTQAVSAGR